MLNVNKALQGAGQNGRPGWPLRVGRGRQLRLNRCECLAGFFKLLLELRQRLTRERAERFIRCLHGRPIDLEFLLQRLNLDLRIPPAQGQEVERLQVLEDHLVLEFHDGREGEAMVSRSASRWRRCSVRNSTAARAK